MTEKQFDSFIKEALKNRDISPLFEDCEADIPPHEFSEGFEKNMRRLIKNTRRPKITTFGKFGKFIKHFAAVAAAAALIMTTGVTGVKTIRVDAWQTSFKDYIIKVFPDHIIISFDPTTRDNYPSTLEKKYMPTAIPEGFVLASYSLQEDYTYLRYENGNDFIIYTQSTHGTGTSNLDNEFANLEHYIDETGHEYLVHSSIPGYCPGPDYCFMWDDGEYAFELYGTFEWEDMLELCRSVKEWKPQEELK